MSTNGPTPGTGPYGQQQPVPPPPPQHAPAAPPQPQQSQGAPQMSYGYPQGNVPPQQGQQGYGYQQPFPGAPTSPVQPRKKSKAGLIIALVFALLLLGGAGGAAWFLLGSGSAEPYWSVPTEASGLSNVEEVEGTWFTDKAVVQTWAGGVKAFDKKTGKRLWAAPLPGSGNVPCLAPSESGGDVGVVAYGASVDGLRTVCDHVVAYDLTSGEELWHKKLKAKAEAGGDLELSLARAGDVAVVKTNREHMALKVSDGNAAWDPNQLLNKDCRDVSYTGGKNLIAVRSCSSGDSLEGTARYWHDVALIDPGTGKADWTESVKGEEAENVMAISTSPVVIASDVKGMTALDDKTGEVRSTFEKSAENMRYVRFGDQNGSPMRTTGAAGKTFVVAGYDPTGGAGGSESMSAFDLDTGKRMWKTKPEKKNHLFPLQTGSGDRILAYEDRPTESDKLVEFAPKDGAMKTVVEYPEDVAKKMSALAQPFWNDDRLYLASIEGSMDSESYALVALPTATE